MLGRKFNLNPITYMQALLSIPHREDMSSTFCSQLAQASTLLPGHSFRSTAKPLAHAQSNSSQTQPLSPSFEGRPPLGHQEFLSALEVSQLAKHSETLPKGVFLGTSVCPSSQAMH